MSKQQNDSPQRRKYFQNHKLRKGILIAVAVIVVGGIAWAKFSGNGGSHEMEALFTVKRGDLQISVLQAGKVQANRSVGLSSEMEGQSTIISIVPEGTYAKEGDVLVELDSSFHKDEIVKHQILVKSAEASLKGAEEAYEIQKNQNDSDIKAAELARDFALIDLKKYTGEVAYTRALETYEKAKNQDGTDGDIVELAPHFAALNPEEDYKDGDWHQQVLKARNDIKTAETALKLAENKLKGTQRLWDRNYVTKTELETDQASYDKAEIALEHAKEAKKLLINYDHPKQLAKFIADYEEAERQLGRVRRKAASQLVQKEADLAAERATYRIEKERLDAHEDQLSKSVIKAPQPGLVIYGSSSGGGPPWGRRGGLIAQGETVYERQKLIELPDLSILRADMNLNESVRDMIKPGQQAIITIEALAGVTLRGHVEKVAVLPDSEQNWMNPDLTLYPATVLIDDKCEALTPGMTAKVQIIIADLKDVLYVPVEGVTIRRNREVCIVVKGPEKKETPVEVGLSNGSYIEIKSGLRKGDKVLANAPVTPAEAGSLNKPEVAEFEKEWPPLPDQATDTPKGAEEKPEKPPADMEERARTFLQNLTPEQKKQMEERLKQLGIEGEITPEKLRQLMPRQGRSRPEGESPPERPGGPDLRREPRPGGPSAARQGAEQTRASENQ